MKFLAFEIPHEPRELAGWLERQLVGLDLRDLVVELESLRIGEARRESLSEILGDRLPQVLQNGLQALSVIQLRRLLNAPRALLDLQEQIFIDGGAHWQSVPRSAEHEAAAARVWGRVQAELPTSLTDETAAAGPGVRSDGQTSPGGPARRRRRVTWLAAAALVLFAVTIWLFPAKPPQFGWSRPETYAAQAQRAEFYGELSAQLVQYRQARPQTQRELESWMREFVHGCDRLLEAPLAQLPDDERTLLRAKCREWKDKIEVQRSALASGSPVADVTATVDQTMTRMVAFLDSQAG